MKRYRDFNSEIRKVFGEKVTKITINTSFTCPNVDGTKAKGGCTFCQEASYTGLSYKEGKSIDEQIKEGLPYVTDRQNVKKFFAYFQNGTNTYAPLPTLISNFEQTLKYDEIVGIMIATRPDCLDNDILDYLQKLGEKKYLWLEIGLQSHRNDILKAINRGHTYEEFEDCIMRVQKRNLRHCVHLITGLPGETVKDNIDKALEMNRLKVDAVKIHNLVVFKHTELARQYLKNEVKIQTLEEYSSQCVDFLEHLHPDILVQRLSAHGPRRLTVAPEWSVNKWNILNAVHDELEKRDTWQGKKLTDTFAPKPPVSPQDRTPA